MKTKIQYPGGLAITIEHEEQFEPQVLEVQEGNFSNDLIKNNELLNLKIVELEIENSDLRKELSKIHVRPVTDMKLSKKKEKPAPEKKEKAAPKWAKKPCANCGNLFQPTGPRSSVCPDCKAAAAPSEPGRNTIAATGI